VSGGIKEYQGWYRVYVVSETAQVELRSGRVSAPASRLAPMHAPSGPLHVLHTLHVHSRHAAVHAASRTQGLTLVQFSAQLKHVLWDTLCLWAGSMTRNGSGCTEKWTSVSPCPHHARRPPPSCLPACYRLQACSCSRRRGGYLRTYCCACCRRLAYYSRREAGAYTRSPFTLELNLSNSRTHS